MTAFAAGPQPSRAGEHGRHALVPSMRVVHAGAAPGAEGARVRHRDDRLPGRVAGVAEQVQRSAAAVAEQHVVAQVVPDHQAAHEVLAHDHVDEVDALLGGDVRIEPERDPRSSRWNTFDRLLGFTFTRPPR